MRWRPCSPRSTGWRKPTIARVHGAAYGGGVGLVACCDIAVAAEEATFALSEVKLGLIPATIGPYVVAAIGARQARRYFLTAERFTAAEALRIGLVHDVVPADAVDRRVAALIAALRAAGPRAQAEAKALVRAVSARPVDDAVIADTVARIAAVRASAEGREGVAAFLRTPPRRVVGRRRGVTTMGGLEQFDVWQLTALAAALGWASGIRLYAVLFIVGGLGFLHWIDLPGGLELLAHPWVLTASGFMFFVEFFADKIPGVDTLWDAVHTFIRIPAGAALAASVFGDASAAAGVAAAILGGTLAAGSHLAKTGSRAVINTSPEPFSNWAASFGEELAVGTVLWLAFAHPIAALVVVGLLVLLMIWLIPKVWRFIRRLLGRFVDGDAGARRDATAMPTRNSPDV